LSSAFWAVSIIGYLGLMYFAVRSSVGVIHNPISGLPAIGWISCFVFLEILKVWLLLVMRRRKRLRPQHILVSLFLFSVLLVAAVKLVTINLNAL